MSQITSFSAVLLCLWAACPVTLGQCSGERGAIGGGGAARLAGAGIGVGAGQFAGRAGGAAGFGFSANPQVFAMAMQQLQRQNQLLQYRMQAMQRQIVGMQRQNQQLLAQIQQLETAGTESQIALNDKTQASGQPATETVNRFTSKRQFSRSGTQ